MPTEIQLQPTSISPNFKRIYSQFENFHGSSLDELPVYPGDMLIIGRDQTDVNTQGPILANWYKRKGINATYVNTTTIGANDVTSIHNYIGTTYTNSGGQLEFVTIIGDPDGGQFSIVTEGSQLDNYYGTLSSGGSNPDPVPDLAVGRLPVTSQGELLGIINKTINYQTQPDTTDRTWFTRAWCIAHTGTGSVSVMSNPSTKEYTRQIMLQYGLNPGALTVNSGHTNTGDLDNRLALGLSVLNDRMSYVGEFYPSDLDNAPQSYMSPFVMVMTCGTGTFDGENALSEEWLRPTLQTGTTPAGAIGCVGLSGLGTHVPFNNIVDAGVMYGLYVLDIQEQGTALIEGKLQLYKNYFETSESGYVSSFSYWSNLMGDAAVPVWRKNPENIIVSRPATINLGTNNVALSVVKSAGSTPVSGALVCLWKGTETYSRGYTDASGQVNLPVTTTTTGNMLLTITKDDIFPKLDTIQVISSLASLAYNSITVDDDNLGGTTGDANGVLNPGETIDLYVNLRNAGTTTTITGISGTLSSTIAGVQVTGATRTYPNLAAGASANPATAFRIHVSSVFNNEPFALYLTATSSIGTQLIRLDFTPVAGDVTFSASTFIDANSHLDPGETGDLTVTFNNSGSRSLLTAEGILRSLDSHIVINDSVGSYGTVTALSNAVNSTNHFNVTANLQTVGGYQAEMQLVITDANGFRDSVNFIQTVGTVSTITPTGPDRYGYYAYDNTETQPANSKSNYLWQEIVPALGGQGTSLGFTDNAEDTDQSSVQTLPFNFTFYGQSFNQVTICTNGWLAFGSQVNTDARNYRVGTPIGPTNQVCAYWDDLIVTGISNGGVYVFNDASTHRYIVEWRTQTRNTATDEVFQIILHDPLAYTSSTGDGKILVQYQTVNENANSASNDNDWATVGIQNFDHSIGLEYCYWNTYSASAAQLQNECAIMYTTDASGYVPTALMLVDPNGGEEWFQHNSETILWLGGDDQPNIKIELSRNGVAGPWETIIASTPNDGSHVITVATPVSSNCRIKISSVSDATQADTSTASFAISTLRVLSPNGGEILNRDSVVTVSWAGGDPSSNVMIELSRHSTSGPWETVVASTPNTRSYSFTLTGSLSLGARIRVSSLTDVTDTDISNADFSIQAMQVNFSESFETGATGWSHASAGGTWLDNWHLSTERASSTSHSFKCGDTETGSYSNLNDARLLSPVISNLPASAKLKFYHQIEAEISGAYPDSAYDGGIIEISANGGAYTQIAPISGYNKTFRYRTSGGNPATGPMPGLPCFSGSITAWTQVQVDLSAYSGQSIQLRWRFGSDAAGGNEGWYIDDVNIVYPVYGVPDPVVPTGLTIRSSLVSGQTTINLSWNGDTNVGYKIYTSTSADGTYELLISTTEHSYSYIPTATDTRRFYIIVGWDGN